MAAVELNVSCPNVDKGGLEFGCDPAAAARVTEAVRAVTRLPLWVKMSPEAATLKGVGLACQEAGADALTAINTIRGLAIDADHPAAAPRQPHRRPLRSGAQAHRAAHGLGAGPHGEDPGDRHRRRGHREPDAVEFLLAGATAVQMGTSSYWDPCGTETVVDELTRWCNDRKIPRLAELTGGLRTDS